eukprot:gnl/TRDRNA2_/TRDRNA2_175068_c0_seq2.p1 gnl/TRDRNA2_/TRDRNA2_175068_c0~~gnl/TRDRNA2_/TRDRNA2_175068_c0_seq2.p1  ORF type:complete len:443 (-),score=37.02 gnl/TRDRNA2_/TRDRNA2_175068_c0_seq2:79-1407(-)
MLVKLIFLVLWDPLHASPKILTDSGGGCTDDSTALIRLVGHQYYAAAKTDSLSGFERMRAAQQAKAATDSERPEITSVHYLNALGKRKYGSRSEAEDGDEAVDDGTDDDVETRESGAEATESEADDGDEAEDEEAETDEDDAAQGDLFQDLAITNFDNIPNHVWVTGEWEPGSREFADVATHLNLIGHRVTLESRWIAWKKEVENRLREWVPIGSRIRYMDNKQMDSSVRIISKMLDDAGIATSVDKAYFNLRPGAFRADLWRYLILWAHGGVYLDANLILKHKVEDWIDFSKDHVVLVHDDLRFLGRPGIWNAMMAARPANKFIEHAIQHVVNNVHEHRYCHDPLNITGPMALSTVLENHPDLRTNLSFTLSMHHADERDGRSDAVVTNNHGVTMAIKPRAGVMHDQSPSHHYSEMWRKHQVYCDEPGPTPDGGSCAPMIH